MVQTSEDRAQYQCRPAVADDHGGFIEQHCRRTVLRSRRATSAAIGGGHQADARPGFPADIACVDIGMAGFAYGTRVRRLAAILVFESHPDLAGFFAPFSFPVQHGEGGGVEIQKFLRGLVFVPFGPFAIGDLNHAIIFNEFFQAVADDSLQQQRLLAEFVKAPCAEPIALHDQQCRRISDNFQCAPDRAGAYILNCCCHASLQFHRAPSFPHAQREVN